VTIDATNRKGRRFRCKVLISPMRNHDGDQDGAILLMEPAEA
jgi:hypothetical protein